MWIAKLVNFNSNAKTKTKTKALNNYFNKWVVVFFVLCCVLINFSGYKALSLPLSLQTGSVGDGFAFAAIYNLEWQSQYQYQSYFGKETYQKFPKERKNSNHITQSLNNSLGYRAGKQFLIIGYINAGFFQYKEKMRDSSGYLSSQLDQYDLGVRFVFDRSRFIFAGSFGVGIDDDFRRVLEYQGSSFQTEYSTAVYPTSIISFGYQATSSLILAQIFFPQTRDIEANTRYKIIDQQLTADHRSKNAIDEPPYIKAFYDTVQTNSLVLSIHYLLDFDSEIQLASSVYYFTDFSDLEDRYQYSMKLDNKDQRVLYGKPLNRDSWNLDLGVRYFANKDFSVIFGVNHQTRSYSDQQFIALEQAHLGGTTFSFAVEFLSNQNLRFSFEGQYMPQVEKTRNYQFLKEDMISHQRVPLSKSSDATLSQGKYALTLSVAYLKDQYQYQDQSQSKQDQATEVPENTTHINQDGKVKTTDK